MTNRRQTADASPAASPVASPGPGAPFGIAGVRVGSGLIPTEVAELLGGLPDAVSGLARGGVSSDAASATVVYVDDADPNVPKFGIAVAVRVEPTADADATIARLQRERWGDPADHAVTGSGAGGANEPAYRLFSRSFDPVQFALPYRPIYFLLWYRANDDYAFMIVAHTATIREDLTRALVAGLGDP